MKETQVKTHTLQGGDMPRSQSGSSCLSLTQNPACRQKTLEKGGGGRSIRLKNAYLRVQRRRPDLGLNSD